MSMSLQFGTRICQSQVVSPNNSIFSSGNPLCIQTRAFISQTLNPSLAFEFDADTLPSMRPICPTCSRPSRVCLCSRIKTPKLDNSVSVTILQHSLERNHPLNSTRIATLGLKNVNVYSVSDVNFDARFIIRSPESDSEVGSDGFAVQQPNIPSELIGSEIEVDHHKNKRIRREGIAGPLLSFSIAKYGAISFLKHQWMIPQALCEKPNFDLLLASLVANNGDLAKGFVVKKWQNRKLDGSSKLEEFEEFEIAIPPGTALLFPSEKSVGVEALDFEVKNLIVLDGTWSKARRIYSENPWLKLLPHLKLDLDKMSLYGEVRTQPRAGYLSTIESIVYAMKAVGVEAQGLDNLLEVFESMVGDQRRCMNERLDQISIV